MVKWISAAVTHRGKVRLVNEDSILAKDSEGIWAVADGMGGHAAGDYASQCIVQRLSNLELSNTDNEKTAELIDEQLNQINELLIDYARDQKFYTVGSTLAALSLNKSGMGLVHWAGDSRVYELSSQGLIQLTKDHSLVQELVDMGEISEEQALNYPSKNVITRAVGAGERLCSGCLLVYIDEPKVYLICSDGLTNEVELSEIQKLLTKLLVEQISGPLKSAALDEQTVRQTLDQNAQQLLDQVLRTPANDNVSFVLVACWPEKAA